MNYTTAVFLINKHVRAITATYEAEPKAKATMFKTLDATIKPGDFIVVPTDTRHGMTVCKVYETDVDIDFDSQAPVLWVVTKVDRADFDHRVEMETQAVAAIRSAETNRKRDELRASLFADHAESLKSRPLASNGDEPAVPG